MEIDGTKLVAVATTEAAAEETDEAETAGQLVGTETGFEDQLDVGQLVGTATTVVLILGVGTTGGTVATVVVQLDV